MKQFARLNYEEFIINGEVNERLPLYNEQIYDIYNLENDSNKYFPDFKIESGNVTLGDTSFLISKSNVTISNNIMNFTGNTNSFIELHKDIMNSNTLELEFNFKITDLSSDSTIFSSNDLTIKVDARNKFIYGEMPNLVGKHTPKPDLDNRAFRFSQDNSIKLNAWHRIKVFKYLAIVSVILDYDTTKSMVCESGFTPSVSYLGKGLKGQISTMNVWKKVETTDSISINIPQQYTIAGLINRGNGSLSIGNLSINVSSSLVIRNGTELLNKAINSDRDYGFIVAFANNSARIFVRDLKTDEILLDNTSSLTYSNVANVTTNGVIKNLIIYKIRLSDAKIIELYKKKFSLNKDGNLLYELDEISGHNKLKVNTGKKYHMQLTRDLNSDCETITNSSTVEFVDGGVESKNEKRKIKLSFAKAINLSNTWDLVYKTKITSLSNGKHYDSLGEGLYWGVEDNKFIIKYLNGQSIVSSEISNLIASEILNEWIVISITYSSGKVTFTVCTSKGIFSTNINKAISSITNEYDLFLGGKDDTLYGQAIYRELSIINGWNVDLAYKEKMFRTKFSYSNNKLVSNVNIVELI